MEFFFGGGVTVIALSGVNSSCLNKAYAILVLSSQFLDLEDENMFSRVGLLAELLLYYCGFVVVGQKASSN